MRTNGKNLDTIKFENSQEVKDILKALEYYLEMNSKAKDNPTIMEFLNPLDVMDMEW